MALLKKNIKDMIKKEKGKPKTMWALRLDPDLYWIIKRKGRAAAPWVRAIMWESIKKEKP